MPKIYTRFLLVAMLFISALAQAQSISITGQSPYNVCAGSVVSISFSTSGTFTAGNTFRVQLSSNYGNTYTDLPGSFTSSPASVTVPASSLAGTNYVFRIVADKPLVISSGGYSFAVVNKPAAQLTGSSAGAFPINPYSYVNLTATLTGGGSYTVILQDSTRFVLDYGYNSTTLPVVPARTTTYSLAGVQNACGTGVVSGSATVLVNPVGFQLLSRGNESLCLGSQLPVYFSTAAPLPANTTFEAELTSTYDGGRSVSLPVSGTVSPLLITLPKQYIGTASSGYQLRVFSRMANLSAWYREGSSLTLEASPRLSLVGPSASAPFGGQVSFPLNYTATSAGTALLSDGQQVTLYGSYYGSSVSVSVFPTATTSYSLVSYAGACSDAVSYGNRTATVRVRPGMRIDSLSAAELCAGNPVTIYYTTTPGYALPGRMNVRFDYGFSAEATPLRPGQLTFTPPASMSPLTGQLIQLRDGLADTLLAQASQPLTVKTVPSLLFLPRSQIVTASGEQYLSVYAYGGGTMQVVLNTGARLVLAGSYYQGYYAQQSLPVFVAETTSFSTVSVRNDCGTGRNVTTATVVVQNTTTPVTGLSIRAADVSQNSACPGSSQWVNVYPTGTFKADNQFQVEVSGPNGAFSGSPVQSFTKAESVSVSLPTLPGSYRVRIASTSPVTRSNEVSFYISSLPTATVQLSLPNGPSSTNSLTIIAGQPVNATYNFSGGRGPYQYETSLGDKGRADYSVQKVYQPTASTSFGLVRVTDACGSTATVANQPTLVTVVSALLRTGSINSSQACIQAPMQVPFVQLGSMPASLSYVVQVSEDLVAWQTVPTSGTTSPLTATLPASLTNKQLYYRVAYLTDGQLVAGTWADTRLTVRSTPNVLLTTPNGATAVQIDRGNSLFPDIKLVELGAEATVLVSGGPTVLRLGATTYGSMQSISQPGTYSIITTYNGCGYGQGTGVIRVTEKPYLSLKTISQTSACVGQAVSFSYAVAGDIDSGNRLSIYLIDNYGSTTNRVLLTETTALSGVVSFSLAASLKPSSYNLQVSASAPATNLYATTLLVDAPVTATLQSAAVAVYEGEPLSIGISTNATINGPYTVTLASPTGLSVVTASYSSQLISVRATQSGSYSLLSAANGCGVGKASGVLSVSVIPLATVTIRPGSYYSVLCTGQKYTMSLNNTGTFGSANTFTVYLADSTGGNLRALPTINGPYQLTVTVPTDVPVSNLYTLRIGSSSPQHLGASSWQSTAIRQAPTGTLTGSTSILKGDSTRLSVVLTGTAPWQLTITDIFGSRTFTASTSPFTLTVRPDTTSGYRLVDVRDSRCGVGTASGTALVTVSRLLATEPTLPLDIRAWPNPTSGWLEVSGEVPGRGDVLFTLHTAGGTLVQQSVGGVRQGRLQHRIDLSGQPAGVYILSAGQDGRRTQFKVVKQ